MTRMSAIAADLDPRAKILASVMESRARRVGDGRRTFRRWQASQALLVEGNMLEAEAREEGPAYQAGKSNGDMNGSKNAQIASRLEKV